MKEISGGGGRDLEGLARNSPEAARDRRIDYGGRKVA